MFLLYTTYTISASKIVKNYPLQKEKRTMSLALYISLSINPILINFPFLLIQYDFRIIKIFIT